MGQDQSTSNKSKQQTTNEDLRWDPNRVWEERKDSIIVNSVTPTDPTVDKPENSTRFVCISDTHSLHNYIKTMPKGDVYFSISYPKIYFAENSAHTKRRDFTPENGENRQNKFWGNFYMY